MAILIVKESQEVRLKLDAQLRAAGHTEVVTARSISEALTHLAQEPAPKSSPVDLILMDVVMPDMDGVGACGFIRSTPHLCDIPVIMLSDHHESSELEAAFDAGAFDYVHAPFRPTELLARIRAALRFKSEIDARKKGEAELAAANEELQRMSNEDTLTTLANRRHFDDTLRTEVRSAIRRRSPLALIILDVDHFKLYNDTYGHDAGDMCLKFVGLQIKRALGRSTDRAARFGGEEFAVILPDTDLTGTTAVTDRIRSRIEGLEIPHQSSTTSRYVTVSLGAVSAIPDTVATPKDFIRAADHQLYLSKEQGRNQSSLTDTLDAASASKASAIPTA